MTEIPLNRQVFQSVKQAIANQKVSQKEFKQIQKAIVQDGVVTEAEQDFLKALKDGYDTEFEVISADQELLGFNPQGLDFADALASIDSSEVRSSQFDRLWNRLAQTGQISEASFARLKESAQTPGDLLFIQNLEQHQPETFTPAGGIAESWQKVDQHWQLDISALREEMQSVNTWGNDKADRLLNTLKHPNPKVQSLAASIIEKNIANNSEPLNLGLLERIKDSKLKSARPDMHQALTSQIKHELRDNFKQLQTHIAEDLQDIQALPNPKAQNQAYTFLAHRLNQYQQQGIISRREPVYQQAAQAIDGGLQTHLNQQGLSAADQLNWLQLKHILTPHEANKDLQALALNPNLAERDDSVRQQAMEYLLVNLPTPKARQLFDKVMQGEGQASKTMQDSAAFYLKDLNRAGQQEYGAMLNKPSEETRLQGIRGLSELGSPESVKRLLKHYQSQAGQTEIEGIQTALNQLKMNPDRKTSAAAFKALQDINQRSESQANNAYEVQQFVEKASQGNQGAFEKLLATFADPVQGQTAFKGMVQTLESATPEQQKDFLSSLQARQNDPEMNPEIDEKLTILLENYAERHNSWAHDQKRLDWLDQPELQANAVRELAQDHPQEHKKIEQKLKQIERQHPQNLSTDQKLDFASAHFGLNPEAAKERLESLLKHSDCSEQAKAQALEHIFKHATLDRSFSQGLAEQALQGEDPSLALKAVKTLEDQRWITPMHYASLLNSPHQNLHNKGIQALSALAIKGNTQSLSALSLKHTESYRSAQKQSLVQGIQSVADSDSVLATAAQSRLNQLKESEQGDLIYPSLPQDGKQRQEIAAKIRSKVSRLHDFDILSFDRLKSRGLIQEYWDSQPSDPRSANNDLQTMGYFNPKKMQSVMIRDYLKEPQNLNEFLSIAPPHTKGEVLKWLQNDKNASSKKITEQILLSTSNIKDHTQMLTEMRDDKAQAFNLKKLLSAEGYDSYSHHYQSLKNFDSNFHQATDTVMKSDSLVLKGDFVGRALLDYKAGKLSPKEAEHAVSHILKSVETPADYDQALQIMHEKHALNEEHLVQLLGAPAYQDLSTAVGRAPAQKGYSNEEQAALEISQFFDKISDPKYAGDGDRVSEWLEIKHPEISQESVYHKYFNKPTLSDRLLVSKLIAQGKVNVSGVSGHFADRALFGTSSMSIFAMHGKINLANFLSGSVKDKAQQFVAMDDFARRVHDQTQNFLESRAEQLEATAQDTTGLGITLNAMQAYIAPYHPSDFTSGMGKLANEAIIEKQIKLRHPQQSKDKAFIDSEKDKIQTFQKYLSHYGNTPDQAASIMQDEAQKAREMKSQLGVAGQYEDSRSDFMRYQAFPLYYEKDMDVLQGLYEEIVTDMSKHGQPIKTVLNASADLENEFKLAKDLGATILGAVTGTSLFVEGAKWASRLGSHYGVNQGRVAGGVRSQAIQEKAHDQLIKDVVWDSISAGVSKGFSSYKQKAQALIQKESEVLFGVTSQTETLIARGLATEAEKDLFAASQVFSKNALKRVEQKLKPLQIGFETFKIAAKEEDLSKALSTGFVETLFNHALGRQAATDHRQYTAAIADQLISPSITALDSTLEKFKGSPPPIREANTELKGQEKRRAEAILKYLSKKHPELKASAPVEIKTFGDFEKLLEQYQRVRETKI